MSYTEIVIKGLSALTLLGQVLLVFWLLLYILERKSKGAYLSRFQTYLSGRYLGLALGVALIATAGSLFFSEVAGLSVCELCWYQRIFMYPLALILGLAWYWKDERVRRYVLPMLAIGTLIASYHYSLHLFPAAPSLICTIDAPDSCAVTPFKHFGYITIPAMNLTANLLIGAILMLGKTEARD